MWEPKGPWWVSTFLQGQDLTLDRYCVSDSPSTDIEPFRTGHLVIITKVQSRGVAIPRRGENSIEGLRF